MIVITAAQWIQAVFFGLFAGGVAIGVTVSIEKLGGVWGGMMASAPITIFAFSFGLGLDNVDTRDNVSKAMLAVPVAMLLNVLVLIIWRELPVYLPKVWSFPVKLTSMLFATLGSWTLSAVVFVVVVNHILGVSGIILGVLSGLIVFVAGWAAVCLSPRQAPKGKNRVSVQMLLARGSLAALAIFLALIIAKTSAIAAGLTSCFPAIFTTTMVSMWISQGPAVGTGAAGPMMLGSFSVVAYSMLYMLFFVFFEFGPVTAPITAWPIAILGYSLPSALLLAKINQRAEQQAAHDETLATVKTEFEFELEASGNEVADGEDLFSHLDGGRVTPGATMSFSAPSPDAVVI